MKNRLDRVNELLKRELANLIVRELTFDAKLVTIQQVDVTPDLKHAHVFVSVIGTFEQQKSAMAQLHDHRKRWQGELSKTVILKNTPRLHFKLDLAAARGDRVLNVLDQLGYSEQPLVAPVDQEFEDDEPLQP